MSIRLCFYEDDAFRQFLPLTFMRPAYCLRAGIVPLFRRAERYFDQPQIALAARHALASTVASKFRDYPVNIIKRENDQSVLFLNGRIRNYASLPEVIHGARRVTRLIAASSEVIGVFFPSQAVQNVPSVATPDQYLAAFRDAQTEVGDLETDGTMYNGCWEIVADIDAEIAADFEYLRPTLGKSDQSKIYTGAYIVKPERVHVGRNVEMLPGSVIDASRGPVAIGDNTRIESQAAIYGPCHIGPNSVVVAGKFVGSSIGHTCRVGGEVEESIFQSYVNKYHAGFIGHSYVGSWVNFGAMTTNSDLKNNYSTIQVSVDGRAVDTGSIKVGSFIGDHTRFGIGTLLNTGICIGVCCNLFGGTLITDREVPSFRWGDTSGYEVYRFDKALKTIRTTAERRNVTLSADEEAVLRELSEGRIDETGIMKF